MNPAEMKVRTRTFALRIIRLVESLPQSRTADVIGKQLIRCGTSVGANYRASCRARSSADFVAKMGIVEEEADETIYWIKLLVDAGLVKIGLVSDLLDEANQLVAIIVSSIKTSKENRSANKPKSAIRNPKSAIGDPKSAFRNPKSAIGRA